MHHLWKHSVLLCIKGQRPRQQPFNVHKYCFSCIIKDTSSEDGLQRWFTTRGTHTFRGQDIRDDVLVPVVLPWQHSHCKEVPLERAQGLNWYTCIYAQHTCTNSLQLRYNFQYTLKSAGDSSCCLSSTYL